MYIVATCILQVCKNWKYLTAVDELWMVKCHEYGEFALILCMLALNLCLLEQHYDLEHCYFTGLGDKCILEIMTR